MKHSDNFMANFYLYRGKIKQRQLVRVGLDREKKLEDKNALLHQSKSREVDYMKQIKKENSEYEELKSNSNKYKMDSEALQQERFFLLQELISMSENRPRRSSTTFENPQENMEIENEKLKDQNFELSNELESMKRKIMDLEDSDFKKSAEIKLVRKMLQKSVQEKEDNSMGNAMDITMQTDTYVKLEAIQSENEE